MYYTKIFEGLATGVVKTLIEHLYQKAVQNYRAEQEEYSKKIWNYILNNKQEILEGRTYLALKASESDWRRDAVRKSKTEESCHPMQSRQFEVAEMLTESFIQRPVLDLTMTENDLLQLMEPGGKKPDKKQRTSIKL